jgi:Ser/Thr protein kinase RdoA (MazF antagonist)
MAKAAPASTGHLVHGMGTALETPAWPMIELGEAEAVLARFPEAGRIEQLLWHSPRPFSAATLIDTTRGQFLQEHAFVSHLAAAGISLPEIMRTADGASALTMGEGTFELQRRAAGADLYRDRPSWTPFLSHVHAHAAGIALAQVHQASRGFDAPARTVQPLVASFTILPASDPMAAAEAYVAARPALAAFLGALPWREELERLFAALAGGLAARLADQPSLWTHNDWHPSNLLWAPDGTVTTVFDFGLSDRTCALHDLATAIERTSVEWLRLGEDDDIADPAAALSLIAGYATIRPLSRAKIEMVVRLLPLVHLEFALSEIAYFAGALGDPAAAMHAWDAYVIGHAQWFLSTPGQDFLAQVGAAAGG